MKAAAIVQPLVATFAGTPLTVAAAGFLTAEEWPAQAAPLLLLSMICRAIAERWESPVSTQDADSLRAAFLVPMRDLAQAISDANDDRIRTASNSLASAFRDSDLV